MRTYTAITQLIANLIGEPLGQYDYLYETACVLLILFFIGLFLIILNFQKSMSRRRNS